MSRDAGEVTPAEATALAAQHGENNDPGLSQRQSSKTVREQPQWYCASNGARFAWGGDHVFEWSQLGSITEVAGGKGTNGNGACVGVHSLHCDEVGNTDQDPELCTGYEKMTLRVDRYQAWVRLKRIFLFAPIESSWLQGAGARTGCLSKLAT